MPLVCRPRFAAHSRRARVSWPTLSLLPAAILLGVLVLAGCGGGEHSAASIQAARKGSGDAPGKPGGRAGQTIPVGVEPASVGTASAYYTATATLEAESRAEVLARTSGVVESLLREEGDRVSAGETLLLLEDDQARLRVAQSEANLAMAQAEFDRRKAMLAGDLLSAEEFEVTQNNLRIREADHELAKLELSYTRVVAPIAGQVVRRLVDLGRNVSPGSPLYELMDVNPLLARVHIPAKRMGFVREGQEMELELDGGVTLTGIVSLVSPIVDPTTGTVKVTAEIVEFPPGTRPGDFAHVRIATARHAQAILVPSRAIFEEQGTDIVYVVEGDQAIRKPVEQGFVDGDYTEVVAGVAEGDLIVVKGQRQLRDGISVDVLEGPPEVLAAFEEKRRAANEDAPGDGGTSSDAS